MPDIVVVCTANIARSPLLQVRLQAEADRRLGTGVLTVSSAGTDARFGDAAATGSRRVAEAWGLDLEHHASRSLAYVPLADVTLSIAMTRRHVRALVDHGAPAERCFTYPELVRILGDRDFSLPPATAGQVTSGPAGATARLRAVVANAHDRRWPWSSFRRSFDVPDPIGADQPVFDRLGARFATESEVLGEALFGPRPGA